MPTKIPTLYRVTRTVRDREGTRTIVFDCYLRNASTLRYMYGERGLEQARKIAARAGYMYAHKPNATYVDTSLSLGGATIEIV